MIQPGRFAVAVAGVFLGACGSPQVVMTTEGPTSAVKSGGGQFAILAAAFESAKTEALSVANGSGVEAPSSQGKFKRLAIDGMDAVAGNCSDFFVSAGENEKTINFARDAVTAAGTLATSVLALRHASDVRIANVAITTATLYNGLDIYTKNFLFGADNIHNVRALIMNALSAHRTAVLADSSPWTFGNAMGVILDHQEVCRPSAIVSLVKVAIKNGNVGPMQPSGGTGPGAAVQDKLVEMQISTEIGHDNGTVPSVAELDALYWYLIVGAEQAELPSIKTALAKAPKGPFNADGTANNTTWNQGKATTVTGYLKQLSAGTQAEIAKRITNAKGTISPPAHGERAMTNPRLQLPAASGDAGSKHYTITVR